MLYCNSFVSEINRKLLGFIYSFRLKISDNKMPRPRKKKHAGGRPKLIDPGTENNEETVDHTGDSTPKSAQGYRTFGQASGVVHQDQGVADQGPGRPPLDPVKGAMNCEELKERKKVIMKQKRKKERIRNIRRRAVSQRKDRQDQEDSSPDDLPEDLDAENDPENEINDDHEDNSENIENCHPRTLARRKEEFLSLLPRDITNQC